MPAPQGPMVLEDEYDLEALDAAWTAKEIAQQPAVWRTVGEALAAERPSTDAFLRPLLARNDLRILLTGAGSSAFAGEVLAPALARTLRRRVEAVATTDLVAAPRAAFAETVPTLLVSFARSGDSPESLAATQLAERYLPEAYHVIVTCNPAGQLFHAHHDAGRSLVLLMPEQANDRGFAMTSSFTSMLLATWLTLSGQADAESVSRAGERALARADVDTAPIAVAEFDRVVYIGSGPLRGLAREAALKMLELCGGRVDTYAESALGFRHGPKAIVNERTLVIVFFSNDPYTRSYDLDILGELRSSPASGVIALGAEHAPAGPPPPAWTVAGLSDADDAMLALPLLIYAQVLALRSSLALGLTPDNPYPSGSVNRVVRGVRIHPLQNA